VKTKRIHNLEKNRWYLFQYVNERTSTDAKHFVQTYPVVPRVLKGSERLFHL